MGSRTIDDAAYGITGCNDLQCGRAAPCERDEIVWRTFDRIGHGAGDERRPGWPDQAGEFPAAAEHRRREGWWGCIPRDAADRGGMRVPYFSFVVGFPITLQLAGEDVDRLRKFIIFINLCTECISCIQ